MYPSNNILIFKRKDKQRWKSIDITLSLLFASISGNSAAQYAIKNREWDVSRYKVAFALIRRVQTFLCHKQTLAEANDGHSERIISIREIVALRNSIREQRLSSANEIFQSTSISSGGGGARGEIHRGK